MRGKKFLHLIDRFFLPPFLYFLSFFLTRPALSGAPKKIGILKLTGIGDLAVATTTLLDLEKAYPNAQIHLFVGRENAVLTSLLPTKNITISTLEIAEVFKNLRQIRAQNFDMFIDLGQWTRYEALLAGLSKAKEVIGFKTAHQYRHYLYSKFIDHQNNCHEAQNFQHLSLLAGVDDTSAPQLRAPKISSPIKPTPKNVVFHPWPSGLHPHLKQWPASHWATLAEKLIKRGYHIAISGSPADRMKQDDLLKTFKTQNIQVTDLCGKLTLEEFAAFLVSAPDLQIVSVNTGIMHMAALLGVKTIALNGPTNPVRWGALGDKVVNLQPQTDLRTGYLNLGFEYPANQEEIMPFISPTDVCAALTNPQD